MSKIQHSQCEHLGEQVPHDFGERKWGNVCKAGRGVVRGAIECCACKAEPDSPFSLKIVEIEAVNSDEPKAPRKECRELGRALNGLEAANYGIDVTTCNCLNKLRICGVHEVCTTAEKRPGLACCRTCLDFDDGEPEPVLEPRHLLYHVMPIAGNGTWQRNLDQLRRRIGMFDGRRAIAIVTDPICDPPEAVRDYLAGEHIDEWIVMPNQPMLREVVTWSALWEQVVDLPGVTFYGHAKGVTHPIHNRVTVHRWADLMYAACLDYWPLVARILRRWPIAGPLFKSGKHFEGSESKWHYSGTYYWARNEAMKPIYREIDQLWYGNESFPGLHFDADQAGVIFGQGTEFDMYQLATMENFEQEFEAWKSANEANRTVTG